VFIELSIYSLNDRPVNPVPVSDESSQVPAQNSVDNQRVSPLTIYRL